MIKAIIFDLDDTLILEKQYIESGFEHLSEFLSRKTGKEAKVLLEILYNSFETDSTKTFNLLFDKLNVEYTAKDIKELVYEYRNHIPNISFIDDVEPTIKKLKNLGYQLGIITDGYKSTQNAKIKVLKALDIFDEIVVTDELGREFWKPHPKSFEIMREKFNVNFDEMMYIGDNPTKDFYIKETYPVTTVRIERAKSVYINHGYFYDVVEDYKINSISELPLLLTDELGGE